LLIQLPFDHDHGGTESKGTWILLSFYIHNHGKVFNNEHDSYPGGFLPYILRTVLLKQVGPVTVDPDNLSFKSKFKRKIEEYTQNWIVSDSKSTTVKVDSDPHVDIYVAYDDEKSKDEAVMLQEITPIINNDTSDKIDILIYDKFTV